MKKLSLLTLIAAAFTACSQDNNDGPGNQPSDPPVPQAPYILYYDAASQSLAAGRWGAVTTDNILLFKFGSVVGFTASIDNYEWQRSDIKFNPTGKNFTNYTSIPYFDESNMTGHLVDGYITDIYHTVANVKAGKGDPCKLVGLRANATDDEIEAHDSGLQLPSFSYFQAIYSDATFEWTTNPVPGGRLKALPTAETFLPQVMIRDHSQMPYIDAIYWSSLPYFNNDPQLGMTPHGGVLIFNDEEVKTNSAMPSGCGLPVRCIQALE